FNTYDLGKYIKKVPTLFIIYIIAYQIYLWFGDLDFLVLLMKFQTGFFAFVTSILGILFFWIIASILSRQKSINFLVYIGRNAYDILLHHLFGFFILNLVFIFFKMTTVKEVVGVYYQIPNIYYKYLYVAFGLVISLLLGYIFKKIVLLFGIYIKSLKKALINYYCGA
ncbi:MAG: hypothetical protein WCP14_03640, partial [bacterium]